MLLTEWCKKGFHLLIFYQPSVPHLKLPSTQIIVDFLRIYREIFSIFVIMFFMIKKPEKSSKINNYGKG